ncbi:MAG: dihydrofolate reductase family protein, partial [Balneolales bacterium]
MDEITRLKQQSGQDILITGNAALVQSLEEADLVDEYRFLVHPTLLSTCKEIAKYCFGINI